MREALKQDNPFMWDDRRREQVRTNPTRVLLDESGRKISLLLEEHGKLHVAFVLIEDGEMPARWRGGTGPSPVHAIQTADLEVGSFVQREDRRAEESRTPELKHAP